MTTEAPRPTTCPVCQSDDIRVHEGETFKWRYAICDACGFHGDEVRVQTLGDGTREEWEAEVRLDAIADMHRIHGVCTAALSAEVERLREIARDAGEAATQLQRDKLTLSRRIGELEALLGRALEAMDDWHIAHSLRIDVRRALASTQPTTKEGV